MQQPKHNLERKTSVAAGSLVAPGALDGVTIMRYAQIYRERSSGGLEQYMRCLDRELLARHRLTVLQTHLVKDDMNGAIEVENVGLGQILWVPVVMRQANSRLADLPSRVGYVYRQTLQLCQQEGKGHGSAMLRSAQNLARNCGGHLRYETAALSDHLPRVLATHKVDLLALHWLSYDSGALIAQALRAKVPYVFINHFDNARFALPLTRKWIAQAAAIGVVSDQGIPEDLRDRCVNLSDSVDTEFFTSEKARPLPPQAHPVVLLAARIQHGKGHHDLIEAARLLKARNIDFVVCFAGAVDSESLHGDLRRSVVAMGLEARVLFPGEISAEEMRDWYASSSIVVLPSYSEGLGRVLLEAQAMGKPVVAYDSGGIREAVLAGETGFLVKEGDVSALADKIGLLLQDEAERQRMGERGREFTLRKFGLSALVQRHESFYLNALSGASAEREGAFLGTRLDPS
jgi:glycosyltransferase involved in cell wall biosynthesis